MINKNRISYLIAIDSFKRYKEGEKMRNDTGETLEYKSQYFDSLIKSFLYFEDYERCVEVINEKEILFNS
jgi:hypothetical protein